MRRRWLYLWLVVVLGLVLFEVGLVTGVIRVNLLTNFYFVILAVAIIGILSIIGAVFVGIFIVYRIYYRQEFTPFEKEMLMMREDVKRLAAKVEELAGRLPGGPPKKA